MPRLFISGILFFLLLGAGYGIVVAAQPTPWDCSDWQAFAHADRTTTILESLAENRGKTLYCGVDQSDTFTKAETWAAGKDRNERDDTVYHGERGRFRGFIAAQEGWLTDGESGITGQSIATIFEFPRPPRRGRRTKTTYYAVNGDVSSCGGANSPAIASNCIGGYATGASITNARGNYNTNIHATVDWPALAKGWARVRCDRDHDTRLVTNVVIDGSWIPTSHNNLGEEPRSIWYNEGSGANRRAYQIRLYTASCVVKEKVSRRQ